MSDKIVVMSEGRIQQVGTPEDIYNEPKNAFVADFIGDSNIFGGIMTGKCKVRFCGAEFECVDDVEHGTMIDAVVRPEDVIVTTPERGRIRGIVTSVVFKGVHYEITVVSGKNEIVIQSTKKADVNSLVGLNIEPDGIHIMRAENIENRIETGVTKDYSLKFLEGELECDVASLISGATINASGVIVDSHGDEIDIDKIKIIVSVKPDDIEMSDDISAGIMKGHIINLIYKGDHYSYVVRTDNDEDFIVHDEDLWNMDDYVSLIIPKEKFHFALKRA
jgi:spermidine/putrescine transport system ATP-binding protein